MKTTVDIPRDLLEDVKNKAAVRTNKEAITIALEEFLRIRRSGELVPLLGTFESFMDQAELKRQRGEP